MATGNDTELLAPPSDVISAVKFANDGSNRLLASSWDCHIYLYDLQEPGGQCIFKYQHRGPVLDTCFGANSSEAFTACLDHGVRRINLETGDDELLSSHQAGAKAVVYAPATSLLISASWDSTLHLHLPHSYGQVYKVVQLPGKAFSMSLSPSKLIVAMASRINHIYDLQSLLSFTTSASTDSSVARKIEPWQQRESSLKFMTRMVACMPDDAGYASSSIEGRVAVEWFDPNAESQARKYAFKCHRQQGADGVDVVYPVNALAFHPVHGTFASGGGDGVVALWDAVAKRRIKQYQRYPSSISSIAFSPDGRLMAVAISPGYEDRKEDMSDGVVKIFVRELGESEAKSKGSK